MRPSMQLSAVSTPAAIWLCAGPDGNAVDKCPLLVAVGKLQVVFEGAIGRELSRPGRRSAPNPARPKPCAPLISIGPA